MDRLASLTAPTRIDAVTVRCVMVPLQTPHVTAGISVSTHLWPEVSAQLLCCTPAAHWLKYANRWNPILAEPLRVDKGVPVVDGVRETGVAWNLTLVERFAI